MPKLSAGLLLFRRSSKSVEIFLVHPGGPFWAKKDTEAWSLPKGEYQHSEDTLSAAKREFKEETSFSAPAGRYIHLGQVKYSNKELQAWAVEATVDAAKVKSNFFEMQWPPKSGKIEHFPEVDKADWFELPVAKKKIVQGQLPLLERLQSQLGVEFSEPQLPTQTALF